MTVTQFFWRLHKMSIAVANKDFHVIMFLFLLLGIIIFWVCFMAFTSTYVTAGYHVVCCVWHLPNKPHRKELPFVLV